MPKVRNFKVIIEQDEDGYFVASVPSIPGCYSQGDTYEGSVKNITEAIELCLEEAKDNSDYKSKIGFNDTKDSKFLGITEVVVSA